MVELSRRKTDNSFIFKDHPEFKPNLSPKEIFQAGAFGGTYFEPIYSNITNKNYKNILKKYIKYGWFENLDIPLMVTNNMYTPNINKYKAEKALTWKLGKKVDGLQKQILMVGFSGIVTFL